MTESNDSPAPGGPLGIGPSLTIFLAGVIAVAMVGFVAGLGHDAPVAGMEGVSGATRATGVADPARDAEVVPSMRYRELRERPIGPNRDFQSEAMRFAGAQTELYAPVEVTREEKERALAERRAIRAYNGAPPTIPHAVDASSSAACLACHQKGAIIGDLVARPIPHEPYASCQQCHVAEHELFAAEMPFAQSHFAGLPAPFEGERAWAGAPPVIPHSVFLRSECNACHGPLGREGLRTSHPWRQSCTQCHALSEERDPAAGTQVKGFRDPGTP